MKRLLSTIAVICALTACSDKAPTLPENLPSAGAEFANAGKAVGVVLETDLGEIHMELYPDRAPISANDFLYYVDNDLFDGQGFYRVITPKNDDKKSGLSLVQGGRLDLNQYTPTIEHESTKVTGFKNTTGSVALAREGLGSASAAFFFINLDENDVLDFGGTRNPDGEGFAVFGRVTQGLEIAYKIQIMETYKKGKAKDLPPAFRLMDDQLLVNPIFIKKAYRK